MPRDPQSAQVSEVRYCLSGGGDSGTTELESVFYSGGRTGPLPSVTVAITSCGGIVCLGERLDDIVANIPDGDWCNNEGGYGSVTLRPQENDPALQVECDMTYGEDAGDPDFEDDEEFLASDFNESDPATSGDTIAVDSTPQPAVCSPKAPAGTALSRTRCTTPTSGQPRPVIPRYGFRVVLSAGHARGSARTRRCRELDRALVAASSKQPKSIRKVPAR